MATVVEFGKPSLDEEILTAMEFIEESEAALRYIVLQRSALNKIRDSLGRNPHGELIDFLNARIAVMDVEVDEAEREIHCWKEILSILEHRSR